MAIADPRSIAGKKYPALLSSHVARKQMKATHGVRKAMRMILGGQRMKYGYILSATYWRCCLGIE